MTSQIATFLMRLFKSAPSDGPTGLYGIDCIVRLFSFSGRWLHQPFAEEVDLTAAAARSLGFAGEQLAKGATQAGSELDITRTLKRLDQQIASRFQMSDGEVQSQLRQMRGTRLVSHCDSTDIG